MGQTISCGLRPHPFSSPTNAPMRRFALCSRRRCCLNAVHTRWFRRLKSPAANIAALPRRTQSAVNGNSIKFFSKTAFGDAIGSEQPGAEYIAERAAKRWATHSINPEQGSGFLNVFSPSS